MPWLAIKLFFGGFLKRLTGAFSALLGWIGRYPWQAACLALLLASAWLWRGWNGERAGRLADNLAADAAMKSVMDASEANAAAAQAQVKAVEAKSAELAKDADHAHELALQNARTATDRFIAANRVRPGQGGSCPAPAPAEGNDPGVPPEVPSDPLVFVREPDLQALVEWATVGVEAHNHAVDKINAGLAKVPEGWPEPAF